MQSLESIPSWFADFSDISLEAAQTILSIVVVLAVLLPLFYLTRDKNTTLISSVMLFLVEAFLVGIGWLPFWILVMTIALVAFAVAVVGAEAVTGRS